MHCGARGSGRPTTILRIAAPSRVVGPAGLEPASTTPQVFVSYRDSDRTPHDNSTSDSTLVAELAATIRAALAAGPSTLPPSLRADIARLVGEG